MSHATALYMCAAARAGTLLQRRSLAVETERPTPTPPPPPYEPNYVYPTLMACFAAAIVYCIVT
jgi:hypothetical protein